MIAYLSFRMAFRHFRADFAAMALSVIAVALGVALVVAVEAMNGAVLKGSSTRSTVSSGGHR